MGATLSLFKTLILPAIISLILFLLLTYIIVPVWKRYRARYSNYLPLESLSEQTSSFRQRVQTFLSRYIRPYDWSQNYIGTQYLSREDTDPEGVFDDEDGEELSDVDEHRRLALSLDARRGGADENRRLSRELEGGFKDDSDEEPDAESSIRIVTR